MPYKDEAKPRSNGFEWPLHPLQVLSWIVFGLDVLVFLLFGLPMLSSGARTAVAIFYIVSVIVVVCGAYVATRCNPADPQVIGGVIPDQEADATRPFCSVCSVPVGVRSKHCRECNKCVDTFDHHCMWLNNCIGAANYRAFFVTVSSVMVMTGILLSSCLYLLVLYFNSKDLIKEQAPALSFLEDVPEEFFLSVYLALIVVNLPLFVLDGQLVFLHMLLMSQKMTTYEYIMQKRDAAEARKMRGLDVADVRSCIKKMMGCLDWVVLCRCGKRRRGRLEKAAATKDRDAPAVEGIASAVAVGEIPAESKTSWRGESDVPMDLFVTGERPGDAEIGPKDVALGGLEDDVPGNSHEAATASCGQVNDMLPFAAEDAHAKVASASGPCTAPSRSLEDSRPWPRDCVCVGDLDRPQDKQPQSPRASSGSHLNDDILSCGCDPSARCAPRWL